MKKKGVNFLLILIVLLAAVFIGKDLLIRVGVEQAVKAVTGLPLKIDSLKVGLAPTTIDIRGMRLFNPPGFAESLMIDIPEIYVDYNLAEMLTGKVHLNDVRLDLNEFIVVKSKEGAVNINYLKTIQEKLPPPKPGQEPVKIDNLTLKMNRVVYKDYAKGGAEPVVKEIKLGIDQTYKDIKDLNTIIAIIVVKAVSQTALSNIPGLDTVNVKELNSLFSGTLKGATDSTKVILKETTGTLKNTEQGLKETAGKITDIFKKK